MTVVALWRYPVKSLAGEEVDALDIDERGVVGDRLWSVRDPDGKLGSGKSSRRFRKMEGLLALRSSYAGDVPVLSFPDGRDLRADHPDVHEALSAHVGRPVTLARETDVPHFDEGPLHVVTTAQLARISALHGRRVDVRRLRPNLVLHTGVEPVLDEAAWTGRTLRVGTAELKVREPMSRCVMVGMAQVDVPADGDLLSTVTRENDLNLGLVVDVVRPGHVALGDPVTQL
jgi:uncharacterized protein YcbX